MNSEPPPASRAKYRLPLHDEAEETPAEPQLPVSSLLPLLRGNAVWFCRLRWCVAGILALAGVAAWWLPTELWGIRLTPGWPLAMAAVLAAFNLAYTATLPSVYRWEKTWPVRLHLWIQIVVDLIVLTAGVHYVGSIESVVPFMFLFHIVLACIFFPRWESLAVTLVAATFFLACVLLEWHRVIPPQTVLVDDASAFRSALPGGFWVVRMGFIFLIWGIIWYLASRLAGALRQREHNLAVTNYLLEKSGRARTRQMMHTAHQLKAPFDAIRSNAMMMVEGYCGTLTEDAEMVAKRIADRCEKVAQQIVDMLQLARLRSEAESPAAPGDVRLEELIGKAIARVEPTANRRGIRIEANVEPLTVRAVEDHLQVLIDNLTSNAVNYSYEDGVVTLACRPASPEAVELTVRDRGIGIPADKLDRVFQDFYRTSEAVQHNKASTGLGLAIVRQAARAAHVGVEVESAPGWGTEFTLTIPTRPRGPQTGESAGHTADPTGTPERAAQPGHP